MLARKYFLVDLLIYILVDYHINQEILSGWLIWLTFLHTFLLTFISARKYFPVDLFGWLFWLTFFYVYTFWLTFISTRKYFPVYLFGGLSSIHSGWLSCQPGNTFGWLLGWLSSIHSYWISYQPGNTFRLTYLVDFFGWLSSILSGCLWYQPGNTLQLIICLTSLADFLLFILVDFYISQEILVVDLFGWLVWLTSYKHSNWFSFQPRNTFSWFIWLTSLADFLLYIRLTFMSARKYFWLTYLVDSFVDLLLYILVVFYINQEILSRWLIR